MYEDIRTILYLLYKIVPDEWDSIQVGCIKKINDSVGVIIRTVHDQNGKCEFELNELKSKSMYSENEINSALATITMICKRLLKTNKNVNEFTIDATIYGDVNIIVKEAKPTEPIIDKIKEVTKKALETVKEIGEKLHNESYEDMDFVNKYDYISEAVEPLKWFFVKPLQNLEFIDEFERTYHCKLQTDFKELFYQNNGGAPSKPVFKLMFVGKFTVLNLLSFNDKKYHKGEELVTDVLKYIREHNKNYKLLPFANAGMNQYVCLNEHYEVVVFNTERNKIYKVAKDIKKFLQMLRQ